MGESKQALAEYQTKHANALQEEKRQEKIHAKDEFMSILMDILPTVKAPCIRQYAIFNLQK